MGEFPRIWKNLVNSETGLPVVVKSVQKIMDARHHPDHISLHDEFELVYMQEIDRGTFYIDDKTVSVRTDDLLLIKPRIPHYLKVECTRPCRFVVLKFSFAQSDETNISDISANDFLSFISENNDFGGFFKLSSNYCSTISTIMQQIMHEDKSPDGESAFLRSLLTMELFVWLSRSLREQWETNLSTKGHKLQEILESARAYINNNYNNDISLSDIAGYVYLSTSHFARAFKKHYGTSPIQYLLSVRIEKAKSLLEETNLKVGDIALSVGFSAQQRFNDIFKKHLDVSPSEYRQKYKENLLNKE
ncbi:MAG: AraC family transcriptional regulator [Clostridia bacterium]|nr:AraC family transcriptional regulator [Clostridia bacterium]